MSVCKVSSRGAGKPDLRATALARSLQNKKVSNNNSTPNIWEKQGGVHGGFHMGKGA